MNKLVDTLLKTLVNKPVKKLVNTLVDKAGNEAGHGGCRTTPNHLTSLLSTNIFSFAF